MAGTLYLVPTPIGNLGDISPRMADTLAQADFIAAEDTRVTVKLLNHLGLKKPMVTYHRHNTAASGQAVLDRLLAGESCALVTDAGMPAISDPGEEMVALCAAAGVPVVPIPGPCALVTALAASGQPTGRFTFEGFLAMNKKNRRAHLESLRGEERTMIFYEAPHKLVATLRDLADTFGREREISLCRELTKLHEEIRRTTLGEAADWYGEETPRGEFVLVVRGAQPEEEGECTLEDGLTLAERLRDFLITRFGFQMNGRRQTREGVTVHLPSVLCYDFHDGENCCKRNLPAPEGFEVVSGPALELWSQRLLENWNLYKAERQESPCRESAAQGGGRLYPGPAGGRGPPGGPALRELHQLEGDKAPAGPGRPVERESRACGPAGKVKGK